MSDWVIKRYSTAFKRQVVAEIESGALGVSQAQRRYGIGSNSTLYEWLRTYGTHYKPSKVIRVQTPDEVDRLRLLQAEKQELQAALAEAHLQILRLSSTIEVMEEMQALEDKQRAAKKKPTQDSLPSVATSDGSAGSDTPASSVAFKRGRP